MSNKFPYHFQWSTTHPHIAWVDVKNNSVAEEVAVVGIDPKNGDLYFLPINALDSVDRDRLIHIISKRDAEKYHLWDLMSTTTLKNGMNALEYFNQLVTVRTIGGQLIKPGAGKIGTTFNVGRGLSNNPTQPNVPTPPPPPQPKGRATKPVAKTETDSENLFTTEQLEKSVKRK